jgi:hypothetical protein
MITLLILFALPCYCAERPRTPRPSNNSHSYQKLPSKMRCHNACGPDCIYVLVPAQKNPYPDRNDLKTGVDMDNSQATTHLSSDEERSMSRDSSDDEAPTELHRTTSTPGLLGWIFRLIGIR